MLGKAGWTQIASAKLVLTYSTSFQSKQTKLYRYLYQPFWEYIWSLDIYN